MAKWARVITCRLHSFKNINSFYDCLIGLRRIKNKVPLYTLGIIILTDSPPCTPRRYEYIVCPCLNALRSANVLRKR